LPIVVLLYAGGIVLGNYYSPSLGWLFGCCVPLSIWSLVWAPRRKLALALLLPLLGWTNLATRIAPLSPYDLRLCLGDRAAYVTLRGRLCEAPVYREYERNRRVSGHSVADLDVEALSREGAWQPAFGRVAITLPAALDDRFFAGRRMDVTGVLQLPKGPAAPGQFDYRAYLKYQGIFYLLRTESTNDWKLADESNATVPLKPPLADRFNSWAQRTLAKGLFGEDESLRLIWAMVLGWKPALTPEVAEPFMQSGTLHIFAISGLHIALISGILVSLFRVLRVPRAACGLVVVPLIWFYTLATGWQASAIRSTIMMTIIIFGWSLERPSDLLNSLAAAGLIILAWDPCQLFQAGFQLSFFVVLGLAVIVPPIEKWRQYLLQPDPLLPPELRPRWKRWLDPPVRLITTSLATSLAAWLGSMPWIAYYFYMITPGSLLANLVIVPLSSIALMSSLGSIVCGDWCPFLTELFNHSSWLWMKLMIGLSEWFAALPGAYLYVRPPVVAEFVLYYLILSGVLSGVFVAPRWRGWAWLAAALLLAAWTWHWCAHRNRICLTILPLRAGAVFVDAPGRSRDLLVDCGDESAAEAMVKPFLRSQGVNRLAGLLLTHGDLHHVGGLETVNKRFPIAKTLTSPARFRSPAYREIAAKLLRTPERWRQIKRGDTIGPWKVLHPASDDQLSPAVNSAVVLYGEFYGRRVLLVSKLGRAGQSKLLEREPDLRADVVVAGLPSPSETLSDAFLERLQPRVLIVGCGEFPASARPTAQLRERFSRLGIPVIYTCDGGAAMAILRPGRLEVRTMSGAAWAWPSSSDLAQ
jgi:ComEC/Rec2-related protein